MHYGLIKSKTEIQGSSRTGEDGKQSSISDGAGDLGGSVDAILQSIGLAQVGSKSKIVDGGSANQSMSRRQNL